MRTYSASGLPIIKIAELKNGITDSTQFFAGDKGEKYLIHDKDILFSWSGNPDTSIDVFIWASGDAVLNQHTFNVKSKEGFRWFVYLMLKYFKPQFAQIASNKQTTGLGHVTAADLKRLTFIYDRDEIASFEEMIGPTMDMVFSRYLRKGFSGKITVYRILDSRRENFRLDKAYEHKVDVINVVTAPEIEMMIILNENRYDDFKKSGMKPSEYCMLVLKLHRVKSYNFVTQYFSDPSILIAAMKRYKEVSRIPKGEWALLDLVR